MRKWIFLVLSPVCVALVYNITGIIHNITGIFHDIGISFISDEHDLSTKQDKHQQPILPTTSKPSPSHTSFQERNQKPDQPNDDSKSNSETIKNTDIRHMKLFVSTASYSSLDIHISAAFKEALENDRIGFQLVDTPDNADIITQMHVLASRTFPTRESTLGEPIWKSVASVEITTHAVNSPTQFTLSGDGSKSSTNKDKAQNDALNTAFADAVEKFKHEVDNYR